MHEFRDPNELSILDAYNKFIEDNQYPDDEVAECLEERIADGDKVWVAESSPNAGLHIFNYFAFGGPYLTLVEKDGKVTIAQLNERDELVGIAEFTSLSKSKNYVNGIAYIEDHCQATLDATLAELELEDIPEAS
jgi:hypothetical protein